MKSPSFLIFFSVMFMSVVHAGEADQGFLDFKPEIHSSNGSKDITPAQEERIRMLINEALGNSHSMNIPIIDENGQIIENNEINNIELNFDNFDYTTYKVTAESDTFYILSDDNGLRSILFKNEIPKLKEKIDNINLKNKIKNQNMINENINKEISNKNSKPIANIKGKK